MGRPRCRCNEPDCPDCGPKNPSWADVEAKPTGDDDDPEVEYLDDEEVGEDIKGWS